MPYEGSNPRIRAKNRGRCCSASEVFVDCLLSKGQAQCSVAIHE